MKKTSVTFINSINNNKYEIPVVEISIKFLETEHITLFTNLIQWFIYIGNDPTGNKVVPIDDFISRPFFVDGRKVAEVDDVLYRLKYLFNNGIYNYDASVFMNRIETAIHNSKVKPEFISKVFNCLKDGICENK